MADLKSPLGYTFWQFFGKRFQDEIILDLFLAHILEIVRKKSGNHDLLIYVPERFEIKLIWKDI